MKAIIGVPVNRKGSYIINKFIENQRAIKETSKIQTQLVLATEEQDFSNELQSKFSGTSLDYRIINFQVKRPEWAKDRIWAITQAREEIRKFSIISDADFLIFLDCDMTYGNDLVNELIKETEKGYDVVYNCYLLKNGRLTLNGFGGTLLTQSVFKSVPFRCYETSDHTAVVDEGFFFEMDLMRKKANIFSGIISESAHFVSPNVFLSLKPRNLSFLEKIKSSYLIRKFISLFTDSPKVMVIFTKIGYILSRHVW